MPIPRRRTAAASTGSLHHRRKPLACTAVRGPQTRRAPSRRFAPARPKQSRRRRGWCVLLAHDRQRRVRTSAGSRWLLGLPKRLESSCQARFS
jgi:hypothetical protein